MWDCEVQVCVNGGAVPFRFDADYPLNEWTGLDEMEREPVAWCVLICWTDTLEEGHFVWQPQEEQNA